MFLFWALKIVIAKKTVGNRKKMGPLQAIRRGTKYISTTITNSTNFQNPYQMWSSNKKMLLFRFHTSTAFNFWYNIDKLRFGFSSTLSSLCLCCATAHSSQSVFISFNFHKKSNHIHICKLLEYSFQCVFANIFFLLSSLLLSHLSNKSLWIVFVRSMHATGLLVNAHCTSHNYSPSQTTTTSQSWCSAPFLFFFYYVKILTFCPLCSKNSWHSASCFYLFNVFFVVVALRCCLSWSVERAKEIRNRSKMQMAHLKAINKWTGQKKVVN